MPTKTTMILKCTCVHPTQDTMFGSQMRVHNWAVKKLVWRCSVCSKEKPGNSVPVISIATKE